MVMINTKNSVNKYEKDELKERERVGQISLINIGRLNKYRMIDTIDGDVICLSLYNRRCESNDHVRYRGKIIIQ